MHVGYERSFVKSSFSNRVVFVPCQVEIIMFVHGGLLDGVQLVESMINFHMF